MCGCTGEAKDHAVGGLDGCIRSCCVSDLPGDGQSHDKKSTS